MKKKNQKTPKKSESTFWNDFKKSLDNNPKIATHTRLETWAVAGVPDVVICDVGGHYHFIELKSISGNVVNLSGHQVAWMTRHAHASAWIFVRKNATKTLPAKYFLYHATQAVNLKFDGLSVDSMYSSEDPNFEKFTNLILKI